MIDRRGFFGTAIGILMLPALAVAHHGWSWTDGGDFRLTGVIRTVELGNPHGLLGVEAEGELWTVEIGQPGRNARAGLTDDLLVPGVELTVEGERSVNPAELVMKAERVIIAGTLYDLYPERS